MHPGFGSGKVPVALVGIIGGACSVVHSKLLFCTNTADLLIRCAGAASVLSYPRGEGGTGKSGFITGRL